MKTVEQAQQAAAVPTGTTEVTPRGLLCSAKITPAHREKLAIVYVRQSSPKQVLENRESTARQYAFAEQAVALGWPRSRVVIIDDDLGKSGRSAEGRTGFERLVTEVTLNHAGLVLGLEMSRLARSSQDWHAFFEMCALFGTLIADEDGLYDGNDPNDRLILGLKGIMSEMELHVMRNRLDHGRLNKARRGELFFSAPLGYVRLPTGKVDFDPDEQARAAVGLIFEKFEELGSIHAVFFWMIEHGVQLPIRLRQGAHKGCLEWRRASLSTLAQVLHHPLYAGAYAYGRRPETRKNRCRGPRPSRQWLPMEQWQVLLRDHLPAYISWEQFLRNQERLTQNQTRPDTRGTPRNGRALLSGLLVCGRCGWRMQVFYGSRDKAHYRCGHAQATATELICSGLSAEPLDDLVGAQVLRALAPASLELSLKAQGDLRRERARLENHWRQKLQRARYDAELAERRYRAVDPDNRLVAATLERQWEDGLRQERQLTEDYERWCRQTLPPLSAADEARITALAADIPALWQAPTTTNADRQAILRCLVERVVVQVERDSERGEVTIHWAGGYESRHAFARSVSRYQQRSDFDQIMGRVVALHAAGKTAAAIAAVLNAEGYRPLRYGSTFNRKVVRDLLLLRGLTDERHDTSLLGRHEWHVGTLAGKLKMARKRLWDWARRGWIHSRRTAVQNVVILWADDDEIRRLRTLLHSKRDGALGYPPELTTPKERSTKRPANR
jgi:DNA invertase Pin-like site-specific DNA recombinase